MKDFSMFMKKYIVMAALFGIAASLPFEMSASCKNHRGAQNHYNDLLGRSAYDATQVVGGLYGSQKEK